MSRIRKPLLELEPGQGGIVFSLNGGHGFIRRLGTRGIQSGKRIKLVTKQPGGPLVVESGSSQLTMGRGMARRVIVELEE